MNKLLFKRTYLTHKEITPPCQGKGYHSTLFCCFRDFLDKVVNALDLLHLLPVHLPDLADQNLTDELVQHRLVQLRDRGLLANLRDERPHIAFLLIRVAHHFGQVLQLLPFLPLCRSAACPTDTPHNPVFVALPQTANATLYPPVCNSHRPAHSPDRCCYRVYVPSIPS